MALSVSETSPTCHMVTWSLHEKGARGWHFFSTLSPVSTCVETIWRIVLAFGGTRLKRSILLTQVEEKIWPLLRWVIDSLIMHIACTLYPSSSSSSSSLSLLLSLLLSPLQPHGQVANHVHISCYWSSCPSRFEYLFSSRLATMFAPFPWLHRVGSRKVITRTITLLSPEDNDYYQSLRYSAPRFA